ncbi:MAG: PIN domain-containing protein [Candidatus Limnocylindrales bacterium]
MDTSYVVAIAFREPDHEARLVRLAEFEHVLASNLLEAELWSAFTREGVQDVPQDLLSRISWVMPDRPLSDEIGRVMSAGYLRGGDAWHLACALYLSADPTELAFLTLDGAQESVASKIGFPTS